MNKYFKTVFFLFFVFLKTFCKEQNRESPQLLVSNDGPAILGSNITFSVNLHDYIYDGDLLYLFSDGIQNASIKTSNTSFLYSKSFPEDVYEKGHYKMTVTVETKILKEVIASNISVFELKEYMVGKIVVYSNTKNDEKDVDEVAVGDNITMAVQLYDPNEFFSSANITYMWSIDLERYFSTDNAIIYNYSNPGMSTIVVAVVAHLPNRNWKYGFFNKQLTVKVPVDNVNVSGNPFLHHGEILHLSVSCTGSFPFEYCWRVLAINETTDNLTCIEPIVSTTCKFPIKHYFQNYGTYYIGIYISNDVRIIKKNYTVIVYNVSTKPQLSTVIIPIVCSLLTLIIIAGGIAYWVQQRNQLAIEVANFDFQDESEPYESKTFFEKILDSIACRTCGEGLVITADTRIFDEEHDPLLNNDLPSA